jgi:hypothetical protein
MKHTIGTIDKLWEAIKNGFSLARVNEKGVVNQWYEYVAKKYQGKYYVTEISEGRYIVRGKKNKVLELWSLSDIKEKFKPIGEVKCQSK